MNLVKDLRAKNKSEFYDRVRIYFMSLRAHTMIDDESRANKTSHEVHFATPNVTIIGLSFQLMKQ